jgi:hypothetical protein
MSEARERQYLSSSISSRTYLEREPFSAFFVHTLRACFGEKMASIDRRRRDFAALF